MLHRAANLIQDIYNFVLRNSFVEAIERIDMVDEETMFVHTNDLDARKRNTYISVPIASATTSEKDILMATMHESCTHSVITMGRSVNIMLQGSFRFLLHRMYTKAMTADIAPSMSMAIVKPKNKLLWINYVTLEGELVPGPEHDFLHFVMYVSLSVAERYALDLTCAQFGHLEETLTPLDIYTKTRVENQLWCFELGMAQEAALIHLRERCSTNGVRLPEIYGAFENSLTQSIIEMSTKFNGWMRILECKSEAIYLTRVGHIMRSITCRIEAFINADQTKSLFRKYEFQPTPTTIRELTGEIERKLRHKLRIWGEGYREGPAFITALEAVKQRQKKDKSRWADSGL